MTCKKSTTTFMFLMLVIVLLISASTNVHAQKPSEVYEGCFCEICRAEANQECIAGYRPSLPYTNAERDEYDRRLQSADTRSLFGLNNCIWKEGKYVRFQLRGIKKFDFCVLSGDFLDGDAVQCAEIKDHSFFAATLANARLANMEFINCDFRYANLTGTDFSWSYLHSNCDFYGAKIQGAKLNITPKQLLNTDPFIEENCYKWGQHKKRIL
ncbi:MAG: pentapeptide repeat-containing protein, partial [Planctomycetaceae bacterium]|nr:pentapeptide repeat-containing protein [Planctomycetaceae bacterium]